MSTKDYISDANISFFFLYELYFLTSLIDRWKYGDETLDFNLFEIMLLVRSVLYAGLLYSFSFPAIINVDAAQF